MDSFAVNRERSRLIEEAFGRWLTRRGWHVLPAYDYSGAGDNKAPKLLGATPGAALITPDLLGFAPGKKSTWWEIKLKRHAVLFRQTNTVVTGCSARHWDHYREVERVTGNPVWLVFAHEEENEVRAALLPDLAATAQERRYDGDKFGGGGMVFFPWERLTRLCALSALLG